MLRALCANSCLDLISVCKSEQCEQFITYPCERVFVTISGKEIILYKFGSLITVDSMLIPGCLTLVQHLLHNKDLNSVENHLITLASLQICHQEYSFVFLP